MKLIFSFFAAVVYLTGGVLSAGGILTDEDKEALLNMHNGQRSATALGNAGTQPMAKNMVQLVWGQDIADGAQIWADNCEFKHDWSSYGENLYLAFSTADNIDNRESLVHGVRTWNKEFKDYNYNGNTCAD